MNNDLVTIIVPVYKCEKYIAKCLYSIINQTYKNIEIFTVIDGDFDKSKEICERMSKKDSRIKVIVKENEGVSVARNIGIEAAQGRWIAFVDSDDYIANEYVSKLVLAADEKCADIVICDYYSVEKNRVNKRHFLNIDETVISTVDKTELVTSCIVSTNISSDNDVTNIGVPWGKIYSREYLVNNNLRFVPGLKRMQDAIFNLYAFSNTNKIVYIRDNLYYYYRNAESSTLGYREDYDLTIDMFFDEIKKYNDKYHMLDLANINSKKIILFNELVKLEYAHSDCPVKMNESLKHLNEYYNSRNFKTVISNCNNRCLSKMQKLSVLLLKFNGLDLLYYLIKIRGVLK